MKAVILAAGEGVRLRPLTYYKPKVMIKVGNRPILEYIINALRENNIKEILLVVGYRKERIITYFLDGAEFGVNLEYVTQEKLLGTGHALSVAREKIDDDFIVLPGDNLIDAMLIRDVISTKEKNVAAIYRSEIPSKYGVVSLKGKSIYKITEKPREEISKVVSTGIYKFTESFFDGLNECIRDGNYSLSAAVQKYIDRGMKIRGILTKGMWMDAVYPWDLLNINEKVLQKRMHAIGGKIERNVTLKGAVEIGEGTVIRANTYISGPVIIGKGCEIGPNTVILPSTSIGNNVILHPFTEIRNSIVMSDVSIGSHCLINQSVIGEGVFVGSHVIVNERDAWCHVGNEFKFFKNVGVIIGEMSSVKGGVVIDGGILIGSNAVIDSNIRLRENVDDNTHVV